MANHKITLCPAGCGACPDVEVVGDEVRIGEAGNLAVLTKDEWNLLVDLIQAGSAHEDLTFAHGVDPSAHWARALRPTRRGRSGAT